MPWYRSLFFVLMLSVLIPCISGVIANYIYINNVNYFPAAIAITVILTITGIATAVGYGSSYDDIKKEYHQTNYYGNTNPITRTEFSNVILSMSSFDRRITVIENHTMTIAESLEKLNIKTPKQTIVNNNDEDISL